jgi:D-alanyl-D-alanine-carboxypeptidase/D-alanyl-D-alanine-endopeptidase
MRFHFRHVGYSAAFASAVATFGCAAALGATPTNLQELVAREVGGLIEQHILVGAAVGVVGMGEVHSYYLGRTKKGDGPVPGPDTLFEIGSITKVFTGTALASMQLDGTAKLDDPVKAYLPEGQTVPSFSGQEITLRHLAAQNSALPRLPDNFGRDADPYANYTEEKLYAFLAGHTLRRAPGAVYEYSNLGVGLLGHALARRAGQSYDALIQSRICGPLGMASTMVHTPEADRARVAQGYSLTLELFGIKILSEEAPWTWDAVAGAGALRSTLPDMMKFLAAAMGGDTPLKPAFALAQEPVFEFAPNSSVGLNWHISKNPDTGKTLVWHNGGTGGYHSFLGFQPETGLGVVVLANTSADQVDAAAIGILDGIGKLLAPAVNPAPSVIPAQAGI